jgi:hypothetical protein
LNTIPLQTSIPLDLLITGAAGGVTGQSPTVILQRKADGHYWDGNSSFGAAVVEIPLAEVDSVNQPGLYRVMFEGQGGDSTNNVYVAYYNNPAPIPVLTNEIHKIVSASTIIDGQYQLRFPGYAGETAPLNWNDPATTVKSAIEAHLVANGHTGPGSVIVSKVVPAEDNINGGFFVEWAGEYAGTEITPTLVVWYTVYTDNGHNEVQSMTFDPAPDAGQFRLNWDGGPGDLIDWNADESALQDGIDSVPGLGSNTDITGDIASGASVEFISGLALTPVSTLSTADNTFTGTGTSPVSITIDKDTEGAPKTLTAVNSVEVQAGGGGNNAIHEIYSDETCLGGVYQLRFPGYTGETTPALNWNDGAATIQTSIENHLIFNGHTGPGSVTVTANDAMDNTINTGFQIEWTGEYANTPIDPILVVFYNTYWEDGINEVQFITFDNVPASGSFRVAWDGGPGDLISWDADEAAIQAGINSVPLLTGNVTVSGSFGGGIYVEFINTYAQTPVGTMHEEDNTLGFAGVLPTVIDIQKTQVGEPRGTSSVECSEEQKGSTTSPTAYLGSAVDEFVFSNQAATVNSLAIAQAVAAKILSNPGIPIDSADIASQTTLLVTKAEVEDIQARMATQASLSAFAASATAKLDEILLIIQPITGASMITFNVTDQASLPVPGVQITLKNTTSAITVAVGYTDINGQLVLGLPGVYGNPAVFNVFFFKPFYTFGTQPYVLTVTGNQTVNVASVSFQPTPVLPNSCACYCYMVDASGAPVVGELLRAKLVSNFPFSPGSGILATKTEVEATSDSSGYVQLNLIQGGTYEISAPALYITLTNFLIPLDTSLDLSTQLRYNS